MTSEPVNPGGETGSDAFPDDGRVRGLFTDRSGGTSSRPYESLNLGGAVGDNAAAVATNRARVAAAAGLGPSAVVWMRQVHGTEVTPVAVPGESLPDTDGIVTASSGVGLAVLVADCVPILLADPGAGVIGAVHAGRLGAAGGIALRALDKMVDLGASVERIEVVLGPAICGRCYEVPARMRDEVEAELAGSASTTDRGTPGLDLRAGLARQLRQAGVHGVDVDPRCTFTSAELFSHRRGAPSGRFAGLIWLPD